jgi:hypothetical protein
MQKTEVVLGPRLENKKAFGAIYDFRSRLLHGDVDIPLRYTQWDGVKKYESFRDELVESEGLALATLIATLQRMLAQAQTDLKFQYKLHTETASL